MAGKHEALGLDNIPNRKARDESAYQFLEAELRERIKARKLTRENKVERTTPLWMTELIA